MTVSRIHPHQVILTAIAVFQSVQEAVSIIVGQRHRLCIGSAQLETLQHIRIQTIEGSRTVKGINPTVSVRRSVKTLT